jgi:methionyl-tRNA synthetase
VVDPSVLADTYGAEALRYYLMSDMATGRDADFSVERLITRYNGDLANSLGNLLNRTLNMTHRYRAGVVHRRGSDSPLRDHAETAAAAFTRAMDQFQPSAAIAAVDEFATACNAYIDMTAPWNIAKDPERADALDHVLYALVESLRIIAVLISPVTPAAAQEICFQLNWRGEFAASEIAWGVIHDGHTVGKPTPVFPRIETPAL